EAGQLLDIATDRPLMALKALEQAGFAGVALFGRRIHLLAKDPEKARQRIETLLTQQGISLLDITPRIPSLEDVFVYRVMALEKEARSQ
ncbi:MAG: ABC transporter ATP-binding protein, partial [Deltaproteobacteria bacterium]|nr:ABC transporter ATP-binding protein [Candidatus Tharpellaceae bacterium]